MYKFIFAFVIAFYIVDEANGQKKQPLNPIIETNSFGTEVGCTAFTNPANYICNTSFTYPAPINNNSAYVSASGADNGCLNTVPNQAWFIITINSLHNTTLSFQETNSNNLDVDAAIWGPIQNNDLANACNATLNPPLTCDYRVNAEADLTLNNVQVGQKYILLITNYSNANTDISIVQPQGGSVTFCMASLTNRCISPTANISGSQTIPSGNYTPVSVSLTGASPWTFNVAGIGNVSTSTNPYTFYASPSITTNYTLNSVSNTCGAGTVSGNALITVVPCVKPDAILVTSNDLVNSGDPSELKVKVTGSLPTTLYFSDGKVHSATTAVYTKNVYPVKDTTISLVRTVNGCGDGTFSGKKTIKVFNSEEYLVACYPFSGNANDEKGNNSGTVHGQVTLTSDRFGNRNSAYEFDGSTGYISFPSIDQDLKNNNFTISCWVNVSEVPQSNFYPILRIGGKRIIGVAKGDISPSGFKWFFNVQPDMFGRVAYYDTHDSNNVNEWRHLALKRSGDSLKVYIDGIYNGFDMGFFEAGFDESMPNYIGGTGANFFKGKIDDIKIFKGTLNDNEIYKLYTELHGNCEYQQDLLPEQVSCYLFNGNANDNHGFNHGIVSDASLTADRFGNQYSAYLFNGVSSRITLPTSGLNNLQYSYSAWIYPLSYPLTNSNYQILSLGGGSEFQSIHLDDLREIVMTSAGRSPVPQSNTSSTSNSIALNQWSHIVSVRTLNEGLIYINGELQSRRIHNASVDYSDIPTGKVGSSVNDSNFFHGRVDDIKIFKGVLNAGEIKALYTAKNSTCNFNRCPISEHLTTPVISATNLSRSSIITSKSSISGTPTVFSTNESVILYPGFETSNNVTFKAQIAGCKID